MAPPSSNGRSVNLMWTWNNPTRGGDEVLRAFEALPNFVYVVFQKEVGEEEGTPHFQGYAEFSGAQRWVTLQGRLSRALGPGPGFHFESRRGTQEQAINYCTKQDTRVEGPWTTGTPKESRQGQRSDLIGFRDAVKRGAATFELVEDDSFFPVFAKYPRLLPSLQSLYGGRAPRLDGVRVVLLYGRTGVGKTRSVFEQHPEGLYRMPLTSGFWLDGYDGDDTVLFDDFAGAASHVSLAQLLQMLDRYPLRVPVKGSFVWFKPRTIYITTNNHPSKWYDYMDRQEQFRALGRRFSEVYWNASQIPYETESDRSRFLDGLVEEPPVLPHYVNILRLAEARRDNGL